MAGSVASVACAVASVAGSVASVAGAVASVTVAVKAYVVVASIPHPRCFPGKTLYLLVEIAMSLH